MTDQPTLVIMAAGMGSRFGGNKQIAPVDDAGHLIIDFSIFDAVRAGFGRIVCVIKPEMEADFRRAIGDRIARREYSYVKLILIIRSVIKILKKCLSLGSRHVHLPVAI